MPTAWETQNAKEKQQVQTVSNIATISANTINSVIQYFRPEAAVAQEGSGIALLISVIGAAAIAGISFITGKERQKETAQKTKEENASYDYIDKILSKLAQAGEQLINQGVQPGTSQFETLLQQILTQELIYKGNCDADIQIPTAQGSKDLTLWVSVRGGATQLIPVSPLFRIPPNLLSYWNSRCSAIHDAWLSIYNDVVIKKQRSQLLDQDARQLNKQVWIERLAIGGVGLALLIMMIRYGAKIK